MQAKPSKGFWATALRIPPIFLGCVYVTRNELPPHTGMAAPRVGPCYIRVYVGGRGRSWESEQSTLKFIESGT